VGAARTYGTDQKMDCAGNRKAPPPCRYDSERREPDSAADLLGSASDDP
jgi:hypothetical protein